jgi:hypothetical protein
VFSLSLNGWLALRQTIFVQFVVTGLSFKKSVQVVLLLFLEDFFLQLVLLILFDVLKLFPKLFRSVLRLLDYDYLLTFCVG